MIVETLLQSYVTEILIDSFQPFYDCFFNILKQRRDRTLEK